MTVQSFAQEEEMAWFPMSDKWEVCHQFQQFLPTKSHAEMTQNEHKAFLTNVNKICPDERVEDKVFRK